MDPSAPGLDPSLPPEPAPRSPAEPVEEAPAPGSRPRLHLLLLLATFVTTTLAGVGLHESLPASLFFVEAALAVAKQPALLLGGLTFSLPLLTIFMTHEMGHYLVARRCGVQASLPYFIPVPFGLGTMGAVISMQGGQRSRRDILAIGAAGPLAGFVVAFGVLVAGMALSGVKSGDEINYLAYTQGVVVEGDSLVYALARWLVWGRLPPGADVFIHPTAYAGWFGMYLTWLNLQPFSQFDGGHVAYALFGRHSRAFSLGVMGFMAALFAVTLNPLWISLTVVFIAFGFAIGFTHPPIADRTPLGLKHALLAVACAIVLVVTFVPDPWHTYELPEGLYDAPAQVKR